MTGILPFVEKIFDVQTDISLFRILETPLTRCCRNLSDGHPGTYNHSINVASIGEAAAEAIGANGLTSSGGCLFLRYRQDAEARLYTD